MAAKQAILLNGVPICGRCYNAVRAEQQQQQAAQAVPPSGFQVVSETATTQELLTGTAAGKDASALPGGGVPAPIPFDKAAVPIDQVFQPDPQAEAQQEAPPPSSPPPPSKRDSARRTGIVPAEPAYDRNRVYMIGGVSAAAAFVVVLLAYYFIFRSDTEPEPKPGKNTPTKKQAYSPQLPSGTPTLPPSIIDPTKKGGTNGVPPVTKKSYRVLAQEYEEIRRIPDGEKDRKAAALKAFIEECHDPILTARARSLYEKTTGVSAEPPLKPTKAKLDKKAVGLQAEYFRGRDLNRNKLITSQTDMVVSLNVKNPRPPGVPSSDFSARWEGYLYVGKKGIYTIVTEADDGVRLDLSDRRVVSNWGDHAKEMNRKTLELEAGYYKLKLEYYQGVGDGEISLRWSLKDGFDERIVTSDNLFHEGK